MTTSNKNTIANDFTEHLFREFYQEVFSSLLIKFGVHNMQTIEDALQESFYKALKSWTYDSMPMNPKNWLFSVTKNHLINELKRSAKTKELKNAKLSIEDSQQSYSKKNENDQLRLLLACSKLDLDDHSKLIFTLKSISGFGVKEISSNLLLSQENIYKKLQRAKKKLRLLAPNYFSITSRATYSKEDITYLEAIIYFMFNEGYDSANKASENPINKEICYEAVRLGHLLLRFGKEETTNHLLALCYFHMARFDTRSDVFGQFVSLPEQDRKKWDKTLIRIGFDHLKKPFELNRYYLEALIVSHHIIAKSFKATNWKAILSLYDLLITFNNSPIVLLNRAICMYELGEQEQARAEFWRLKTSLSENVYYTTSMAAYLEDKDLELSIFWYKKSMENTEQDFRKQLIATKLNNLKKL